MLFMVLCFVATAYAQNTLTELLPAYAGKTYLSMYCISTDVIPTNFGAYEATDRCCAEHNNCRKVDTSKLLTCDCEEAFRSCLRTNKPTPGENIFRTKLGKAYFNQVAPKCIRRGGVATCENKISSMSGAGIRCGKYSITPGIEYLVLDNPFYEDV